MTLFLDRMEFVNYNQIAVFHSNRAESCPHTDIFKVFFFFLWLFVVLKITFWQWFVSRFSFYFFNVVELKSVFFFLLFLITWVMSQNKYLAGHVIVIVWSHPWSRIMPFSRPTTELLAGWHKFIKRILMADP